MSVKSSESEVVSLRKLAQHMAEFRRETLTTAHLLVAIASKSSPAADLLMERRLDVETLMRLARASNESSRDPIGDAIVRAASVARTSGAREPSAIHLLIALLKDRESGAYRALSQSGIDMARLQAAATGFANGLVTPRRLVSREARSTKTVKQVDRAGREPEVSSWQSRQKPATGVIVPLFPPSKPAFQRPKPVQNPPSENKASEPSTQKPEKTTRSSHKPGKHKTSPASQNPAIRFQLDPKSFPTITSLGLNLNIAAAEGQLEPAIGRAIEIEQALDVLAKRRANNPLIVGPPGVGKSTIARALANHIVAHASPRPLDERILIELPINQLLSGMTRATLPERMTALCKEVLAANGKLVVMVDEATQLFLTEGAEAGSEMKTALASGEFPLVTTCTTEEYRRLMEAEPALGKCFTPVEIEEPSTEQAIAMVMGVKSSLEEHHHLEIEESAVNAGVNWSVRYLPGRALPDKALSILDLASARARRRNNKSVDEAVVAEVIAEMTDMPKERLLQTDQDRMLGLERLLAEQVVGHEQPISRIATILRRNAAGFRNQRPIGSFLLLGPTGVGKTETAKAIASALFHGASAMTRLDLSEFAEPHALARLIGAPPGYIGHEAGGQLTESVRRRPYQVLLLDEFEKAHRDVQQAFLQVFDEGRMTDGRGRTVDFTNTVIVMTSNLGAMEAREAADTRSIGFSRNASSRKDNAKDDVKDAVMAAARSALPPELYNRIDEVLFFESLTRDHVREVARRLLADLSKRLKEARNIVIEWDDAGIDALLDSGGYEPSLGARPVKRAIARFVEAPASEMILRQEIDAGDVLFVGSESGQVLLSRSSPRDN